MQAIAYMYLSLGVLIWSGYGALLALMDFSEFKQREALYKLFGHLFLFFITAACMLLGEFQW